MMFLLELEHQIQISNLTRIQVSVVPTTADTAYCFGNMRTDALCGVRHQCDSTQRCPTQAARNLHHHCVPGVSFPAQAARVAWFAICSNLLYITVRIIIVRIRYNTVRLRIIIFRMRYVTVWYAACIIVRIQNNTVRYASSSSEYGTVRIIFVRIRYNTVRIVIVRILYT